MTIVSTGTPAKMSSHSILSRPNPLAAKFAYSDPKMRYGLELEAEQQTTSQREVKFTPFNRNYIQARNADGHFRYHGK